MISNIFKLLGHFSEKLSNFSDNWKVIVSRSFLNQFYRITSSSRDRFSDLRFDVNQLTTKYETSI